MIYNIESSHLKLKTMVLKGAKLRLEMSILIPFSSGYAASGAQARTFFHHPIPVRKFWKNPDPAMLEFSSSGHPGRS